MLQDVVCSAKSHGENGYALDGQACASIACQACQWYQQGLWQAGSWQPVVPIHNDCHATRCPDISLACCTTLVAIL